MAQATTCCGADDWISQVRSPDGSLPAPRATGRYTAVCRRLQLVLVAAGHGPSGLEGRIFAPRFTEAVDAPQRRSISINQSFRLAGALG